MKTKLNDYPTHNNAINPAQRAFSRVMTARDITKDWGESLALQYAAQFSKAQQATMDRIAGCINILGEERVRCDVMKGA